MAGRSANVTSLEALDRFEAALRRLQEEASIALDELDMEIHRAVEWIQHECKHYWKHQVRRGYQQVTEARVALERKRMFPIGDHRPSCYDEKKALQQAKQRLALAQEKVETVRRWSWAITQAVTEYKGDIGPFANWLSVDLPKAIAAVQRMGDALDTYVGVATLEAETPEGVAPEEQLDGSAGRAGSPPQPASAEQEQVDPALSGSPEDEMGPDDGLGPAGTGDGRSP